MIISHRKKFAFFANQKTGSKAVGLMLRLSGVFDANDIMSAQPFLGTRTAQFRLPEYNLNGIKTTLVDHMTPAAAIEAGYITLEQLREYSCYAFLRDPREWFLATRMAMQINRYGKVAKKGERVSGIASPQHTYFLVNNEQVVTALDFDNYEQEIRLMLEQLDGYEHMDVAQISKVHPGSLINGVDYNPEQHKEDTAFYKKVMPHKCV